MLGLDWNHETTRRKHAIKSKAGTVCVVLSLLGACAGSSYGADAPAVVPSAARSSQSESQVSSQTKTASTRQNTQKTPSSVPDLFDDPLKALREHRLFYATSPRTERDLERLTATSTPFSVTLPLEIDRSRKRMLVSVKIDGHTFHPMVDTGGPVGIVLTESLAKPLKLQGKSSTLVTGVQGEEGVRYGLAHSMTLGGLTLQSVLAIVKRDAPGYPNKCIIGTKIFERYRLTFDLAAKTMTLARGGVLILSPTYGETITVPFRYDEDGLVFLPVTVLDQQMWSMLDSGADINLLSLGTAKRVAEQLPPKSSTLSIFGDTKVGTGDIRGKITAMGLASPVPISINTTQYASSHEKYNFSTTGQVGISFVEEMGEPYENKPTGISLGMEFFLQFRRVIIDYPNHILILQGPEHGAPINMHSSGSDPGKPWPGYHWQHCGDGWVEAPDKAVTGTLPSTTVPSSSVRTTTSSTVIGISVVVNGVTTVYPAGSAVTVNIDGSVHVTPPAAPTGTNAPVVMPGG